MPEYEYTDANGHTTTVTHRMLYTTAVICSTCDQEMHKRPPEIAAVLWGGLTPSRGDIHPKFRQFLDTTDERRDKFQEKLDERKNRKSNADDLPG